MEHDSKLIVGVDLGDKESHICLLNKETGDEDHSKVAMTFSAVQRTFSTIPAKKVVMEVGGNSRWFSNHLKEMGFEVIVADARRIPLISKSNTKNDKNDAILLAKLGASDLELLNPITHRSDTAHMDLAQIKARDALVGNRTRLINHVRGTLKPFGIRLGTLTTNVNVVQVYSQIPERLAPALHPLLDNIKQLTSQIRLFDRQIQKLCEECYPETFGLSQVKGVGSMTALAFILTLDDHTRFEKSRDVGSYLGLCPRQSDSGEVVSQLGITKAGNGHLRRLLVHCAHYIMGPFGEDSDLRRWGLALSERGGGNAKKRAVVAVARKLSVLLHRLWVTQAEYKPLRNSEATVGASKQEAELQ